MKYFIVFEFVKNNPNYRALDPNTHGQPRLISDKNNQVLDLPVAISSQADINGLQASLEEELDLLRCLITNISELKGE